MFTEWSSHLSKSVLFVRGSCTFILLVVYTGADTLNDNCSQGELRIASRTDHATDQFSQGRLDICINSVWGTICGIRFGTKDANVACRQLGYEGQGMCMNNIAITTKTIIVTVLICWSSYAGSYAFSRAEFGEGTGMIYLERIECAGDEDTLLDCPMNVELGFSTCYHSRDAGIRCYGL